MGGCERITNVGAFFLFTEVGELGDVVKFAKTFYFAALPFFATKKRKFENMKTGDGKVEFGVVASMRRAIGFVPFVSSNPHRSRSFGVA